MTAEPLSTIAFPANHGVPPVRRASDGERKLALLDVDGTLTKEHSIWQFVLEGRGRWTGEGERNLERFLAGELSYEDFCHADAELLRGEEYALLERLAHTVPMYHGVDALFERLKERDYTVVLLSTGLRLLTSYFTARYAIHSCHVNDLGVSEGRVTGAAVVDVMGEKDAVTAALVADTRPEFVVAVGDSAGDLPMFDVADVRIAVNAGNPEVLRRTNVHLTGDDLTPLCDLL